MIFIKNIIKVEGVKKILRLATQRPTSLLK